ncbi:chain length determinant protein EpsF [Ideonella sp.]|uniref:chain length determinant protein EpsF n=1 Tax=Ideonella sp. TaxID=1929293 RepID=UPI002B45CBAE|nr:chain length determinant protein EpsF [Ideonella sp.]HJV70891.1 chain length determinant protein EpsF [Ideonella sp.]
MNLGNVIAVLRARWLPAVLAFALVLGAAVAYTVLAPKMYTATATLVIDIKPDPVSSMLYGGAASPAMMNTQVEVIRSDRVALRVVRNLKLTEVPEIRKLWEKISKGDGTIEDWLVEFMLRNVDVQVARAGSNVVNVAYRGTEPQFVATIANAFVQAYLETAVELRVDPAREYSGFFGKQVDEARAALEAAQLRLSKFQQAQGIIATDERYDVEMARLNMLSQQLVSLQALSSESSSRQAQVATNAANLSEVLNNPLVAALKTDVNRAEARVQELSARYGDKHPQVVEARATLSEQRARLAAETRNVTGGVSVSARIDRAREGQVRASLEEQRAKVLRMKEVRDQSTVLARDVENAQRSYDLLLNRYNQSNLESQNRQSNASMLARATPPGAPSSPKVAANLMIGIFFGIAVGLGVAFSLEQFDKRIRVPGDAITALGLPVIGIMPTPTIGRRMRVQLAQAQDRMISGRRLPAPGKGS